MKHPDQLLNRLDWLLSALTSSELGGPARQYDERLWADFCSVASSAQQSDLTTPNPDMQQEAVTPKFMVTCPTTSPTMLTVQPAEREDLDTD